jgi:hypothetical protein
MPTSVLKPPRRKRGGQPGNRNASKYGFYSHSFTRSEVKRLETGMKGELNDEEALLNILIDRTYKVMEAEELSYGELVVGLRAISQAIGRIESIHRSRKAIYEAETTVVKALDELKYIPLEED